MHRTLCAARGLCIATATASVQALLLGLALSSPVAAQATAQAAAAGDSTIGTTPGTAPGSATSGGILGGLSGLAAGLGATLRAGGLRSTSEAGVGATAADTMRLMPPDAAPQAAAQAPAQSSAQTSTLAQAISSAEAAAPQPGAAQPERYTEYHPVIIELYTSQGCSSCPPADALLSEIADRDDVIPLALHVDYWDYIGWKDVFASPTFTKRQKTYARAAGEHAIYTPQMIVGGNDALVGVKPRQLASLIGTKSATPSTIRIALERQGDVLHIRLDARPPLSKPARVQLVRYKPQETMTIDSGENAGRTIRYSNIVTEWAPIAEWPGTGPVDLEAPMTGTEPAVVIVQESGPGPILAAERLR